MLTQQGSACQDPAEDVEATAVALQVLKCQHSSGGFGGSERHDPHMLYTVSAVQVLALYDKLDMLDVDRVVSCKPHSQQNPRDSLHGPCAPVYSASVVTVHTA